MENKKEKILFESRDLYISAVCLAVGLKLLRLEKDSRTRMATFVFSDPHNNSSQIISKHWSNKLMISSRGLIEAINELKTRIHSGI